MRIGFSFSFRADGLVLFYNGNLFGHAILKGDFIVLDLDNTYVMHLLLLFHTLTLFLNMLNGMLALAMWAKIEWKG